MEQGIRVFNLARFIAIEGLNPENDISLKIYYYLKERYKVETVFVKPVIKIPKWAALLKKSLMKRRKLFKSDNYVDQTYDIPVNFFEESFFMLNKLGIRHTLKIPFEYKLLKRNLEEKVEKFKPDLIHAHTTFPDGYYAFKLKKKRGIPYIITARDEHSSNYESEIYQDILRNAEHIHTPSAALFNQLKDSFPIKLQPHPLEPKWLEGQKSKQFETLNMITVCRLMEMKNIDIVLKAVKILHQNGFKVTYKIIGEGNYRKELENLTKELEISDIVTFEGRKSHEEIKEYYAGTNIFIMLSRPEIYGRVYFEAAAQGLVVIGSKNTGAHGHLSDNEGIFIQESVDNLVHVLRETKKERFAELSNNARKSAKKFSKDRITKSYYDIIRNAIGYN